MGRRLFKILSALSLVLLVGAAASEVKPAAVLRGCGGTAVSFSQNGSRLLTASEDGCRVWDASTLQPLTPVLHHGDRITDAQIGSDGKCVLTTDAVSVQAWDVEAGNALGPRLKPATSGNVVAAISPNGRTAVTGTSRAGTGSPPTADDRVATLWELATGKVLVRLSHAYFVPYVAFSPDGRRIVTVSGVVDNGRVQEHAYIWDSGTGRQIAMVKDVDAVSANISFSRDGRRFALSMWYAVGVFDADTGNPVAVIRDFEREHLPGAVALSADGSRVAAHEQFGGTPVWDVKTRQQIGPTSQGLLTRRVVLSPDGKRVLVDGGSDHAAAVVDVGSGRAVLTIPTLAADVASFSPDGKQIAVGTGSDHSTRIWKVPPELN